MLKNYLIIALRTLWRNKFFSLVNILGLSVGVACCMLIFLYAKDEISFDRFHTNKENIYRVTADATYANGNKSQMGSTGMMPGPAFKKDIPDVVDFLRIKPTFFTVKNKNEVFEQEGIFADENLFTFFSFPLLYGDSKTALSNIRSIVISEDMAEKYFGKKDAVGDLLNISFGEGFEPFVVSGIAKKSPQNSSLKIDMVLPMAYDQLKDKDTHWTNFYLNTFVSLKPGSTVKAVEAKMGQVYTIEAGEEIKELEAKYATKEDVVYHLQPLLKMHLDTEYLVDNGLTGSSNPMYSYILIGIAAFVLLIACINFINLTIARSLKRAKEIGIRKVIGSQRRQLIFQFLGESFTLSFLAFVSAALLAYTTLPFFNLLANKQLAFSYLLDIKLITGYMALFIVTGMLAGFYPALVLSGFKPVETLYGKLRFSGKNYLSKSLVVFQFTLSTFLIIATITLYSQFSYLTNFDLGYDSKNIVSVNTSKLSSKKLGLLKNELYKNTAIKIVSADQGGSRTTTAHINGTKDIDFSFVHIDEDYLRLFKIPVISGRNFSKEIASDSVNAVLINETFAKNAGWKKPLGEIVDFFYNAKKCRVIGVVKDYHFETLESKMRPQLFTLEPAYKFRHVYVKIGQFNKVNALHHIEKTFKTLNPDTPYNYSFVDSDNEEIYASEAKWKQIIAFASLLTIFISCMGLFGLAALSAEKRAKEIGIRKVLGASVRSIVQKISGEFVKLVAIASCISVPLAWWAMNKWLENYPYRIELKMTTFCLTLILVSLIAFLTVSYQAIKAAISNPVKSLRTE